MACALPDQERKPEPALNRGTLFPSDFVTSTLQIGYKYIKIYLSAPALPSMHTGGIYLFYACGRLNVHTNSMLAIYRRSECLLASFSISRKNTRLSLLLKWLFSGSWYKYRRLYADKGETELNGDPYFVDKDVTEILGY